MTGNGTQAAAKRASKKLTLDQHQRGLLKRFMREWVAPRWRELLWALVLTGLLAATTGAYPMIIKASFDTLDEGAKRGAALRARRHRHRDDAAQPVSLPADGGDATASSCA